MGVFPLKLTAFTFNNLKRWSISAWNTEANSAVFIMKGEGHLNFAIPQEDHKNLAHTAEGVTKIYKTFKIFRALPPLQVKNDTSLIP